MRILTLTFLLALGSLGSGCAAFRMETPPGFARVSQSEDLTHYKGGDNVGLSVRVFDNVEGGTLGFWTDDLTTKLTRRGYTFDKMADLQSDNGVAGKRLDFTYSPDESTTKAYSVVLFATDAHRVVVQLAGDPEPQARQGKQLEQLASAMTIRGCRSRGDIC